jgi:serine/threonine protein kinase
MFHSHAAGSGAAASPTAFLAASSNQFSPSSNQPAAAAAAGRRPRLGLTLTVPKPEPTLQDAEKALLMKGYQVDRFLKSSLFGWCVLAHQLSSGASRSDPSAVPIVIKISRLSLAQQGTSIGEDGRLTFVRDQVLHEGRVLARASSEHVVRCLDEFVDASFHFLVLEWAGTELYDLVANRALSQAETTAYAQQLVDAVAHLHSISIAHLDLSLTNVCINQATRSLSIIDFGVADTAETAPSTAAIVPRAATSRPRSQSVCDDFSSFRSGSSNVSSVPMSPALSVTSSIMSTPRACTSPLSHGHTAQQMQNCSPSHHMTSLSGGSHSPQTHALVEGLEQVCKMDESDDSHVVTATSITPRHLVPTSSVRRQLFTTASDGQAMMLSTPTGAAVASFRMQAIMNDLMQFSPQPPAPTKRLFSPQPLISALPVPIIGSSAASSASSATSAFAWPTPIPTSSSSPVPCSFPSSSSVSPVPPSSSNRANAFSPCAAYSPYTPTSRSRTDAPPSKLHVQSPEQRASVRHLHYLSIDDTQSLLQSAAPAPAWEPFAADVYALGTVLFEMLTRERWDAKQFEHQVINPRRGVLTESAWDLIQKCTAEEERRIDIHQVRNHPFFTTPQTVTARA